MIEHSVFLCNSNENVNVILECITNIYRQAASSFRYVKHAGRKNSVKENVQPQWWDEECNRYKKAKYEKLTLFRGTNDRQVLEEYKTLRGMFKNVCRQKKNEYNQKVTHCSQ